MTFVILGSARRRVRLGIEPPPPLPPGIYSGPRYAPRFPLPDGVTYDTSLGWTVGYPTGVQVSYTPPMNEVLLTDQGSVAANRSLLVNTVANIANDQCRLRLAPVTTNWGDAIHLTGYHVGVGLYIEDARVKDGSFPRAEGKRVQAADTGLAPFVVDGANPWNLPNPSAEIRSAIRIGESAGNIRLTGLDLTVNPAWSRLQPVVGSNVRTGLGGFVEGAHGLGSYVDRVTIDRCKLRGADDKVWWRGTFLNGSRIAHINSFFTNIHFAGQDSQAICSTEGGPSHLIENNWIECAYGEHFIYGGGADLYEADGSPDLDRVWTDLVVRRNVFNFPAAWVARGYVTKNLGEWKGGIRSVTERNVFRGYSLANGGLGGQAFAYVVKYSTGATRYNISRLCRFESCDGFVQLESVRDWELAHLLWDTSMFTGPRPSPLRTIDLAGYGNNPGDYVGFAPGVVSDGRARGLKIHDLTTGNPPRTDEVNVRWLDERDTDGAREGWEVTNNVAMLPNQPVDGTQDGYLFRAPTLNARTNWERRDNTTSTWGGNVIAGPRASRSDRVIPGDTAVETAAALLLDAQYRPQTGSPALGKGCDIDLLNAALAGVETGL